MASCEFFLFHLVYSSSAKVSWSNGGVLLEYAVMFPDACAMLFLAAVKCVTIVLFNTCLC